MFPCEIMHYVQKNMVDIINYKNNHNLKHRMTMKRVQMSSEWSSKNQFEKAFQKSQKQEEQLSLSQA